jgi:hypothetical protein
MKERIKWIVAGFGFMVGIQMLTSLMFMALRQVVEVRPESVSAPYLGVVIFGLTLGAFVLGGFIIGRVEETPRLADAMLAAMATLAFSALIYLALPEGSREQFTGSKWLTDVAGTTASPWLSVSLALPPLIAAAVGAYLGYLITTPVESALERFIGVLGLVGAAGGPLIALIISGLALPWYVPVFGLLIILASMGICYWLFTRRLHEVEAVSIIPEHRHEHRVSGR